MHFSKLIIYFESNTGFLHFSKLRIYFESNRGFLGFSKLRIYFESIVSWEFILKAIQAFWTIVT